LNLNGADPEDVQVVYTVNANAVDQINIGGTTAVQVNIVGGDLGTGATATTVTTTNTDGGTILLNDNGNADIRNVEAGVTARIGTTFAANTATHADGANFAFDVEANMAAIPVLTNAVNATASTANDVTVSLYDSNTANAMVTHTQVGLTVTDVQTLNLSLGAFTYDNGTGNITGADLESVVVTGSGNFDMNTTTIVGDATNRVTLDASALTGNVTAMVLNGTANAVNTVTSGGGTDTFSLDGIAGSTAGFNLTLGAGADTVSVTANGDGATANMTIDGGTGTDTFNLANTVNISASTVNLTSVEQITIAGAATVGSALVDTASLIINGGANSDLTVIVADSEIDLSSLAFTTAMQDADDSVIMDGSGNALSQAFTGSSIHDTITGGTGADVINGGAGADILAGGTGDDTLNGGTGADQFTVTGGREAITGGLGVDNTIMTANAGSVHFTDFDFGGGAGNDNLTLTASAVIKDAAGNAGAVSTGVNGGAVAVAAVAADTAIGNAVTAELIIVGNGADNIDATLNMTDAAIEALIAAQLADGAADISANLATGEGYIGLILNDLNGDGTDDSYLMYEHLASATGAAVTEAAELSLIGIFAGLDAANAAAGDFI
jgi:hypothetical protein